MDPENPLQQQPPTTDPPPPPPPPPSPIVAAAAGAGSDLRVESDVASGTAVEVRKSHRRRSAMASSTGVMVRPAFVHVVRSDLGPDDDELEAGDDRAAIAAWLNEYKGRPNTLRAYVREATRFWLWMANEVRSVELASLKRRDLDAYIAFLAAPPPHWLPAKDADASSRAPRVWTPLRAPMNPDSQRQALVILQSMLTWLRDAGYVERNPALLIRNKGDVPPRKKRDVPPKEVFETGLKMLRDDAEASVGMGRREYLMRRRDAFVYAWIYFTGARRHELAGAACTSVTLTHVGSSDSWWWRVVGKGSKEAHLPLVAQAIESLAWYLGGEVADLPGLLRLRGSAALLRPHLGSKSKIDPSQVHFNVVRASNRIAAWADEQERPELEPLGRARPHDLRAYRTTHLLNAQVEPRHVQSLMRHADFNTTLVYDHTLNEEFHRAISAAS